jgi:xanthine/CO dehydrogenase XdhC/CoxF family maturation factor
VGAPLEPELAQACETVVGTQATQHLRWHHDATAREAWIQFLAPPPRVLVCGGGPDAEPLVALLRTLRFQVTVTDHRPAYAVPGRFPGAVVTLGPAAEVAARVPLDGCFAAVVMSHHLASDAAYLAALAHSPIAHVGLLGPRARRERLMAELGPAARDLALRLHGPVGLDIGAVTPESIALAIAAQLHALAAGRAGSPAARPAGPP